MSKSTKQIELIKDLYRRGKTTESIMECQKILFTNPKEISVRKTLANILALSGKFNIARSHFIKVYELDSNDGDSLFNIAQCAREENKFQEAIRWLDIFTKKYPDNSDGWGSLAESYFQMGEYDLSLEGSEKAILLNPRDHKLFFNRAKTYRALNNCDAALNDLIKATEIKDDQLSYWSEIATLYSSQKRIEDARKAFSRVITTSPQDDYELLLLTEALNIQGKFDGALETGSRLITRGKFLEQAYLQMGVAYSGMRLFGKAYESFCKCLVENPESINGLIQLSHCLVSLNRTNEISPFIDKILNSQPYNLEALSLNVLLLRVQKKESEALSVLTEIYCKNNSRNFLFEQLLFLKNSISSWADYDVIKEQLEKKVLNSDYVGEPFQCLLVSDHPAVQQKVIANYLSHFYSAKIYKNFLFDKQIKARIRIAYISPDFGRHPVTYLTAELFELHDREKFEVIAISLRNRKSDSFKDRIVNSVDQFIDVSTKLEFEIVELIRNLKVDIAIDLCGLTDNHKFGIFVGRVAPVQISYLGYVGTLGTNHDYLIADKLLIPEEFREYYSEKIIYLPNFQMNDRKKTISDQHITKEQLGIPKESFVFCCLNNGFKLNPEIFQVWMRILEKTKDSVLLLFASNDDMKTNLWNEARNFRIEPERIIFMNSVGYDEYLVRLKLPDLFLDTTIYNAGTTASDALWMGLPVLTCIGKSFAARMGASLLNSAGLPELITNSLEEYEWLAIELGNNPEKMSMIKNTLVNNRDKCDLFNSIKTTRNIEAAYEIAYERYLSDSLKEDIYIN